MEVYDGNLLDFDCSKGSRNDPIVIDCDDHESDEDNFVTSSKNSYFPDRSIRSQSITRYFKPLPKSGDTDEEIVILSNQNSSPEYHSKSLKRLSSHTVDHELIGDRIADTISTKKIRRESGGDRENPIILDDTPDVNLSPSLENDAFSSNYTNFNESQGGELSMLYSKNQSFGVSIGSNGVPCINIGTGTNSDDKTGVGYQSLDVPSQSFIIRNSKLVEYAPIGNVAPSRFDNYNPKDFNKFVNESMKYTNKTNNGAFDNSEIVSLCQSSTINQYRGDLITSNESDCLRRLNITGGFNDVHANHTNSFEEQQFKNYRTYGQRIELDEKTIEDILSIEKPKHLMGGRMSDNRWSVIFSRVHNLFKSILYFVEHYDKKSKIETPYHFRGKLKPHQEEGLAFLVKRENDFPCGGILADDMGLGKTAQMISLILYQMDHIKNGELELTRVKIARNRRLLPVNSTLIVAPSGLMGQWSNEISKFTPRGHLNVGIFHGKNRTTNPYDLAKFDIIITSYGTVGSELAYLVDDSDPKDNADKTNISNKTNKKISSSNSVLAKICFQRIILDEAHSIKNRKSLTSKTCARLSGLRRWCLTGTPIHNDLWDAFSLFRFLRTFPIDQEGIWKEYINFSTKHGLSRLEILVDAMLLRRTKDQQNEKGEYLIELPARNVKRVALDMDPKERLIYDQMFKAAQEFVRSFLGNFSEANIEYGNIEVVERNRNPFINASKMSNSCEDKFQNMAYIMVLLLRLRQACNHMSLTKSGLDLRCFDEEKNNMVDEGVLAVAENKINTFMEQNCDESNKGESHLQVFEDSFVSSKLVALFERVDKIICETNDRIVIVSQWTSMLRLIHLHLNRRKIDFVEITGDIDNKLRQLAQENINNVSKNKRIMLLSLKAGGVGLNLIGANHIFILDPHWNPFMEDQACDRIYRIGQTKDVFIHKFVCSNSIEQRVLNLQEKKRGLSDIFLKKAGQKKGCQLTNEDLAYLFEVK